MSKAELIFSPPHKRGKILLVNASRSEIFGRVYGVEVEGEWDHYKVEHNGRVVEVPQLTVAIDLLLLWHSEWEAQHGHV